MTPKTTQGTGLQQDAQLENTEQTNALSREKILGMGKEEIQALQQKLLWAGPEGRQQLKQEIFQNEMSKVSQENKTPEQLDSLKKSLEQKSEAFFDTLVEKSSSSHEMELYIQGEKMLEERRLRAKVLQESLVDDLAGQKQFVLAGLGASGGGIGIWSYFSESQKAAIQNATSRDELDRILRKSVEDTSVKAFGEKMEGGLDSYDIMALFYDAEAKGFKMQDSNDPNNPQKKVTAGVVGALEGIPVIGSWIKAGEKGLTLVKNAFYLRTFRKASQALHISKSTLWTSSTMTVAELRRDLMGFNPRNPHLDPKVKELFHLMDYIENHRGELDTALDRAIDECKDEAMTEEARAAMHAEMSSDNLTILTVLTYKFRDSEHGSNWFTHVLGRIPTMQRFWKYWVRQRSVTWAHLSGFVNGKNQFKNWLIDPQTGELKKFGVEYDARNQMKMKKLAGEMDVLEKELAKLSSEMEESGRLKDPKKRKAQLREFAAKRNVVIQKLDYLANGVWKEDMGRVSRELVQHGGEVDELRRAVSSKSGKFYLNHVTGGETSQAIKQLVGKELLVPHTAQEWDDILKTSFQNRCEQFREVHKTWNEKFVEVGEKCHAKVVVEYDELEKGILKATKGAESHQIGDQLTDIKKSIEKGRKENLFMGSRAARYATRFGLPFLMLGSEAFSVATGRVQKEEMMLDLAEAGLGFVPGVSTALDFRAAFDRTLSGRELPGWTEGWERWQYLGFGVLGAISDVGMVFGGLGYGLRLGVAGLRAPTEVLKTVKAYGKWNSLLFKAGSKVGHVVGSLRQGGRLRKYEKLAQGAEEYGDVSRLLKLTNRIHKGEKLAGDDLKEFQRLKAAGMKLDDLSFLQRRGFLRKGKELWMSTKQGVVRTTLPEQMVKEADATLTSFKKAKQGFSDAKKELVDYLSLTAKGGRDAQKLKDLKENVKNTSLVYRKLKNRRVVEEALLQAKQSQYVEKFRWADTMAKWTSRAGCASLALMVVSAGNITPMNTAQTAYAVAKPVLHGVGKVGHELFIAEHKAPNAIETSVEERMAGILEMNRALQFAELEKKKGVPLERIFTEERMQNPYFQHAAQRLGYAHSEAPSESIERIEEKLTT